MLWDRETLRRPAPRDRLAGPAYRRRSATGCATTGHEERVAELTGLRLDPYFSGTKLTWLAENEPHTWALVERRPLRRRHRRLLPDRPDDPRHLARHRRLQRLAARCCSTSRPGDWSDELCDAVRRPARRAARGGARPGARSRTTDPRAFLGLELPIAGIAGDQQSALFGQTCFDAGDSQVHLRHRLVHPHQHRRRRWCAPTPACSRRRPGAPPTAS